MGFFEKLGEGLRKTRDSIFGSIAGLVNAGEITDELYADLEEQLILADTGADVAMRLVEELLPVDGTQYVELDGALYTIDGGRGADITKGEETVQVLRDGTPGRCTVRVTVEVLDPQQGFSVVGSETHDFLYEQVGERWIFTTFSMVR